LGVLSVFPGRGSIWPSDTASCVAPDAIWAEGPEGNCRVRTGANETVGVPTKQP